MSRQEKTWAEQITWREKRRLSVDLSTVTRNRAQSFVSGKSCIPRKSSSLKSRCQRHSRFIQSARSEEHTSELQSRSDLVCRLLLEKTQASQARGRLARTHSAQRRRSSPHGTALRRHVADYPTSPRRRPHPPRGRALRDARPVPAPP